MAMYELRYEELTDDFQQLIDRIIARNEPVILIGMGVVVVIVLIALYLPIFSLNGVGG